MKTEKGKILYKFEIIQFKTTFYLWVLVQIFGKDNEYMNIVY